MAKIGQGIFGGIQGKLGNLVGSSWKGVNVLKTKPQSVANPRTAPQVAQRDKMTGVVTVAVLFLSVFIKALWDRFASRMSGYNMFVKANISCFSDGVFTNFADFVISQGKMASTIPASQTINRTANTLTFTWLNESGIGFKLASDVLYAVAYNETSGEWAVNCGTLLRSELTAEFAFNTDIEIGDVIHWYSTFKRSDGTIVASSLYRTATVLA